MCQSNSAPLRFDSPKIIWCLSLPLEEKDRHTYWAKQAGTNSMTYVPAKQKARLVNEVPDIATITLAFLKTEPSPADYNWPMQLKRTQSYLTTDLSHYY